MGDYFSKNEIVSAIISKNETCLAIIFKNEIVSRLFSKIKIVSRLFAKIVLTPGPPPTCHRPIACILQGLLQLGRQFWRQFSLMGDTSAIIFQNENCPAIIFGSGHQGLLGHWGRRQFWATILGNHFDHKLGCYSGGVRAQTGQRSVREM